MDSVLLGSGEELSLYMSFLMLTVFLKGYSSDVLCFETFYSMLFHALHFSLLFELQIYLEVFYTLEKL